MFNLGRKVILIQGEIVMKKLVVIFISLSVVMLWSTISLSADSIRCWFPPGWKQKAPLAKAITQELSKHSGLSIKPRIAKTYPDILAAFTTGKPEIVYVGSFVQAIIKARALGTGLVQNVNGKEFYSGVLVYPKDQNPETILKEYPDEISFAAGASSGESSAKAATGGKASIATPNHKATCGAVLAGKAKAGVVKDWWWDSNKSNYPNLAMYKIPGVSMAKNPDNVLAVSNGVTEEQRKKIVSAAIASKGVFGAPEMMVFDPASLQFSLGLMKKGKIDPLTYSW